MHNLLPSLLALAACLYLLYYLSRKPSVLIALFSSYLLLGTAQLAGAFVVRPLLGSTSAISLRWLWSLSVVVGRSRYVFLVLFTAALYRFRLTPLWTGIMIGITGIGVLSPFVVYSILPNLMEITVTGYAFICWLILYLGGRTRGLSPRRATLLKVLVASTGFFMIGLMLDVLKQIPQFSVFLSIPIVDFTPWYLLVTGGAIAIWAYRDLYEPPGIPAGQSGSAWPLLGLYPLTAREKEVLGLILEGETNASIADRLFISESTVKKHINNSFRKLGIRGRWELLRKAGAVHPGNQADTIKFT